MAFGELGPISLATKLEQLKFNDKGERVVSESFRAHKGKVFVLAVLGVEEPNKAIDPNFIRERLKLLSSLEFVVTDGRGNEVPSKTPKNKPKPKKRRGILSDTTGRTALRAFRNAVKQAKK